MSTDFLHERKLLKKGDIVELACDTQCNFMVTDDTNFAKYKRGDSFKCYGGHFKRFPARIEVPRSGHWHVTVDLGGAGANIRYAVRFITSSSP